jgi:hypothetical protein
MVVLRSKGKKNRDFYLNLNTESLQRRGESSCVVCVRKKKYGILFLKNGQMLTMENNMFNIFISLDDFWTAVKPLTFGEGLG